MIAIQGVSKSFGKIRALDRVSLAIAPGERLALVGTNGSGKTTLLRALCGLLRVSGTITIDGADVTRRPEAALRGLVYVPQIVPPLDAPVEELVAAWCRLRGVAPQRCHFHGARLGLDVLKVGRTRVKDLSGGMKQKLLAALAMSAEASILVCDEPTANLDAAAREVFFAEILARPAESVLILCSHRVQEVAHLVTRVVQMDEGKVVTDTPARVMDEQPSAASSVLRLPLPAPLRATEGIA